MKQKTPMQELLEWVRATLPMDLDTPRLIEQKIESMLEKEVDIFELLLDFADYAEADKNSQTTDECVHNYLDSLKNTKEK